MAIMSPDQASSARSSSSPSSAASAVQRAVGYCRFSTIEQSGERHVSLSTQESRIREHCERHGYVLVATFTDVASGRKDDRVQYQKALAFVRGGGADVIVVQFLDRFGRNPREILRRIWELQELGVRVEASDEDISEELVLLVRAGLAGAESRKIGERVRVNMRQAAERGVHFGRVPFGYRKGFSGQSQGPVWRFEPDPEEARVVREMVRLLVEENRGFKRVAETLNAMGYRTRSGKPWTPDTVRKVVTNRALMGDLVYGKRPRKGSPGGELVRVSGVFTPPVLSTEEWDALQARLALRKEAPRGRTHVSEYLLSGLVRCGYCGGPMVGKVGYARRDRKDSWRRCRNYWCSNWQRSRALCAHANGHSAPKLERAVLEHLAQYSDPERVRALLAASLPSEMERIEQELGEVTRQLARLEEDFQHNLDLLKRGVLNEEEFVRANQQRRQERASLEARQVELETRLEARRQQEALAQELPVRIRSFLEDVQTLPVQQAKPLLQSIVKAIYVWRERIELEFRQS